MASIFAIPEDVRKAMTNLGQPENDGTCQQCPHHNIEMDTAGSLYFSGGEVHDSLEDRWYCTDCGVTVPAPDVEPTPGFDINDLPF